MNAKAELISVISKAGDRYGNKLIDFLNLYHLTGLCEATVDQLQDYIQNNLGGKTA